MKKFIIAVFAMLTILSISVPAHAEEEKRSFYDYVRSYGYAGQRKICTYYAYGGGYQMEYWVWSEDVPVVTFKVGDAYCFFSVPNCTYSNPEAGQNPVLYQVTGNQLTSFSFGGTAYAALNALDDIFYLEQDKPVYYLGANIDWTANATDDAVDVTWSGTQGFLEQMEEEGWQNPNDPNRVGGLPMLTFNISAKTIYKFPATFDTKEILTWDFSSISPYKDNPTNYSMEILVSGNLNSDKTIDFSNKVLNTSHQITLSNGGTNVAENNFSWLAFDTGKKFYGTYGWDFPPFTDNVDNSLAGYLVYVRTKDNTDPTQHSAWKIFSVDGHGILSNVGYVQDDDGIKPKPENSNDSGTPTVAPQYSQDNSTSAESDPTGQNYNGAADYNPSTLIANLKAIVNTLQELPTMFGQVCSLMPDWLITLIYVSIGMLVVIGVVKTILN